MSFNADYFRTARCFNIRCHGAWDGVRVKISQEADPKRVKIQLFVDEVDAFEGADLGTIANASPLLLEMLDKMAEMGGHQ